MNNSQFFEIETLQYRIRALTQKIREFENGERYVKMREEADKAAQNLRQTIKELSRENEGLRRELKRMTKNWFDVFDDLSRGHEKEMNRLKAELEKCKIEKINMAKQRDEALDKARERAKELYEVKNELFEQQEKNKALVARIKRDYTNSSISSSKSPNHKTIPNGRIKSGRKPGGQRGHIHHPRKPLEKTRTIEIPAPPEYAENPVFRLTGRMIRKQHINLHIVTDVTEYVTPEFRNTLTGQRVHAAFPDNLVDDVTYDGTVKALAYILKDCCYVSVGKTKQFISDATYGRLNLSTGLICNLSRQFSEKTKEERNETFMRLFAGPSMHSDFTFARMNGKQTSVIICADGKDVLYQGREKKGDDGVKGSPLEHYEGTVISDHEASLIKHGKRNQECLVHVRRYLISSIENEKNLTWNRKMKDWIDKTFEYWKGIKEGDKENPELVRNFIEEYDEIILTGKKEYEYEPPGRYYTEGFNLHKRMAKDKERYVLFLKDPSVEPDNNLVERYARKYKRKAAQVMCFRSQNGSSTFCDGLSVTESIRARKENLFEEVAARFNKP